MTLNRFTSVAVYDYLGNSCLQTRRYDGADDFSKHSRDTVDQQSGAQANTATSTDSSVTGSPDSTDYTSDEYLRLPDKMSPPTRVNIPRCLQKLVSIRKLQARLNSPLLFVSFPRSIENLLPNIWA